MASGLLIGEDVRVGLKDNQGSNVMVMGRPELTKLYTAALDVAEAKSEPLDGEGAFIAGACNVVEQMK
jgi:2-keto-3-deoxy-galactonokinase